MVFVGCVVLGASYMLFQSHARQRVGSVFYIFEDKDSEGGRLKNFLMPLTVAGVWMCVHGSTHL